MTWAPDMLEKAIDSAETDWMRGLEHMTLGAIAAWNDALEDSQVLGGNLDTSDSSDSSDSIPAAYPSQREAE